MITQLAALDDNACTLTKKSIIIARWNGSFSRRMFMLLNVNGERPVKYDRISDPAVGRTITHDKSRHFNSKSLSYWKAAINV